MISATFPASTLSYGDAHRASVIMYRVTSRTLIPVCPTNLIFGSAGGRYPASAMALACCLAVASSRSRFITIISVSRRYPSCLAFSALSETFANPIVLNASFRYGKGSASSSSLTLLIALKSSSLVPPPAGINPTPNSTSPQ